MPMRSTSFASKLRRPHRGGGDGARPGARGSPSSASASSAALASYVAMLLARTGRRTLILYVTGAMLADQMLDLRHGDALLV